MEFSGTKLALFIGPKVLVILRDDFPNIPYPGHWDFPGGARDGDETPEACVMRETWEEVGLHLPASRLIRVAEYSRPILAAARVPSGTSRQSRTSHVLRFLCRSDPK